MSTGEESVSMRDYVDSRFAATNLAISKAEAAAERLHGVSNDIANRMMPKTECQQALRAIEMRQEATQKLVWVGVGIAVAVQLVIGVAGVVVLMHN